ncbi:MAG TPA: aldo/keto reductase [Ferruginibacter sp.]|nr:aldo/keto reductase [Ferruginibacter sp.]HMP20137.1 aldo/keto reductase [Ferruginibacter sp.]
MYQPSDSRYTSIPYNRCGQSGLLLPAIALGLWQNFGNKNELSQMQQLIFHAFDIGITHFDLANNYGPPPGEAERNFGRILKNDLAAYRDELIISTKAGYNMWPGPYGEWGSKKHLVSSLNQSLQRLGLDYVDIFYSHRPDPHTPLEETMQALDYIVRSGKALYAGLSNYDAAQTAHAVAILKQLGTPCLIHQPKYSLLVRQPEVQHHTLHKSLLDVLQENGVGCIAFSPLAQGILTSKYLKEVPAGSRAGRLLGNGAIESKDINAETLLQVNRLNDVAQQRQQSLAQMAIAWLLKDKKVSSVLIGASSVTQLDENVQALRNTQFSNEELQAIETILNPVP